MSIAPDIRESVERAAAGDEAALAELFAAHRPRLGRMVRLRLDRRLQGRVDPSDVLQEAYLDLARKLPEYAQRRDSLPFFLWLRLVVGERLLRVHRQHLGTAMRDPARELSLNPGPWPQASSVSIAAQLLGRVTSASRAAVRAELQQSLRAALNSMEEIDREVITLRHFEDLTNEEVAEVLGLTRAAASKRYVRAMVRLKKIIEHIPELGDPASRAADPADPRQGSPRDVRG